MRAAVFHGREDLRLEDVPEPAVGPDDVKLRVLYAGICGSDLHEYYDGPVFTRVEPHPLTGVSLPVILGHELCGEVVEVAPGVENVRVGDVVVVEPLEGCGTCPHCLSGAVNLCPLRAAHGLSRAGGGFSDYTVVKSRMAHPVPSGIEPLDAALVEPMVVGLHAVKRAPLEAGQVAAVHGTGPIGVGVLLTLRARGIEAIAIDPSPRRREAVRGLGFEHVLDPAETDAGAAVVELTGGRGVHASFDAAGVPAALDAAVASTGPDGTIVIVAVPLQPLVLPVPAFRRLEVRLTFAAGYRSADFPEVIASMAGGHYPSTGWVETIPFDGLIEDGIEPLHRQERIKVVLDVAGSAP